MSVANIRADSLRPPLQQFILLQLSALLRRSCRSCLLFPADADLFQERLNRLFAAKEFLNGNSHVASVALLINLVAQSQSRLLVEIAVLRFLKNGRHVRGDRIGPGITVVTGIVAVQVSEVSHERRAW